MKNTDLKTKLKKGLSILTASTSMLMWVTIPASTNYKINSWGFGAGGQDDMTSSSYAMEGIAGEVAGDLTSANYGARSGLLFAQIAHVPPAATFTNPDSYYNKLHIVINKDSADPSDATYAIAISDDNFVTTQWVQNDNTVGSTLGIEDFQTYTDWGGATGEDIIGLTSSTTYKVKVKSRQGAYTESGLGPEASAATVGVSISFDIDISSTDTETAAPYSLDFGDLSIGSVSTASDKIWIDLDTNAEDGGYVYISGQNDGLASTSTGYTISSASTDLTGASEGFGAQSASDTETSGGPLSPVSPYNGASENVGVLDSSVRELYSTSGSQISGGRASVSLKAKASNTTPSADDYTDTLTIVTAGTF